MSTQISLPFRNILFLFVSNTLLFPAGADSPIRLTAPLVGFVAGGAGSGAGRFAGVTGAARFEAVRIPAETRALLVPPRSRYLLLQTEQQLQTMDTGGQVTAVRGADICVDSSAFSPAGTSFISYCRASRMVTVVSGLPAAARVSATVPGQFLPAGHLKQLAVSDNGQTLAGVEETGTTWLLSSELAPVRVGTQTDVVALGFLPGTSRILLFEHGWNQLWTYTLGTGVTGGRLIAGAGEGLDGVTRLVSTADGARLVLLSESSGRVWHVDTATGETAELELPAAANCLEPMAPADSFLISFRRGEPAWLLEAGPDGPRFRMLPAPPAEETTSAGRAQ